MFRVMNKTTGKIIPMENARFEAKCPDCGVWHEIDPIQLTVIDPEFNFTDCEVYCPDCWEKHKESDFYD